MHSIEIIMVVNHRTDFRIMVLMVDLGIIIITLIDLIEVCQVMEKVEVDLIKVQMLVDHESQVGLSLETPQDVFTTKSQATYLDFV